MCGQGVSNNKIRVSDSKEKQSSRSNPRITNNNRSQHVVECSCFFHRTRPFCFCGEELLTVATPIETHSFLVREGLLAAVTLDLGDFHSLFVQEGLLAAVTLDAGGFKSFFVREALLAAVTLG